MAVTLAGCWTVRETEYPSVAEGKLPTGKEVRVQLVGFDATVTSYLPVYGYTTVADWDGPRYGRHRYGVCRTTTVSTTDYIPQVSPTSAYRDRAVDALEKGGCVLQTAEPTYRIEVRFAGPFERSDDCWAKLGWMVCTIFTANYDAQAWTAKLKIHDGKSGRLLYENDFFQRYETLVWGPIPIFSPGCSEKTSAGYMQNFCLTALTDLAVADALDFLGKH